MARPREGGGGKVTLRLDEQQMPKEFPRVARAFNEEVDGTPQG